MALLRCVDAVSLCFDKDSTIFSLFGQTQAFIMKRDYLFSSGICWPRADCDYSSSLCLSPAFCVSFSIFIPLLLLLQLLHVLCILILFLSLHHLCFVLFQPAHAYNHLWPSYREILPSGNNFLFVPWAADTISCWLTSSSLKFCAVDTNWYWYRCECHYSGVECYFWSSISNAIL